METLKFGELNIGDFFIGLPMDGDNSGHGGLRLDHYLFQKFGGNKAIRSRDSVVSEMPDSMDVIRIKK